MKSSQPDSSGRVLPTKRKAQKNKGFNLVNFFIGATIVVIFVSVFVPFVSGIYTREKLKRESVNYSERRSISPATTSKNAKSIYSCDGRTRCGQMRSYEEAIYFINNCPGTEMDGDGDGDPCEGQF